MARPKKETTEEVVTPAEPQEVVPQEESEAKQKFRAFIENYKAQNPAKYQLKEQELLSKLNKL